MYTGASALGSAGFAQAAPAMVSTLNDTSNTNNFLIAKIPPYF